jgi:hypothetical protein
VTAAARCAGGKNKEGGGFAAAHLLGAPRRLRARSSGLQSAGASRCARQPCGLPWTPETSAAPGGRKSGQAQGLPRQARGAQARVVAGGRGCPDAGERSELAFDNQNEERRKLHEYRSGLQAR